MVEYREVLKFLYKGRYYHMYLDNGNKRFFLREGINGNLEYITLEELFDLILEFKSIPLAMNIEKNGSKMHIVPKIIIGGVATILTISMLSLLLTMYQSYERINEFEKNYSDSGYEYNLYDDMFVSTDSNSSKDLVVDTYLESELLNYLFIYDLDYLDKAIDYENVSIEEVKNVIKNNNGISNKFKDLLYEFCDCLSNKYPDIELRVLYENLKTLEIVECDRDKLLTKTLSVDSYGCYIRNENKIYVLKDYEYIKGTWAYQVIFHEISHCMRTAYWDKDGKRIRVQVEGQNFSNVITAEALNSLFTVSLFDYEEKDVAYQLQSNYHAVMIDCMDNYSIDDYMQHSVSYYAKKLDEFNNDDNYATVILELIQMQYNDYHSEKINALPEGYYPIYDYISNMYYKKYLNSSMSYAEAISVADTLIEKILYDVPDEYNIPIEYFYNYLEGYCNEIGIDTNVKVR